MGMKSLATYPDYDVTIDTLVAAHIIHIQEEAKRLDVEQDLFLCGEWHKRKARITGYVDPRDYIPGIAISVSPEKYNESVAEKVNELIETIDVINIPQRRGILGLLQRFYRANKRYDARRQISELPEASYFSLGTEQEPLASEQVPSHPASVIYSPQQIRYNLLFASENPLFQELSRRNILGHYHVHTTHHPELPQFFSREDIHFGASLKNEFQKRKILLGVGYLGKIDNYVSF